MGKTAQPIKNPFIRTRATLPKWPSVEARDTSLAMFSPKGLSLWWELVVTRRRGHARESSASRVLW